MQESWTTRVNQMNNQLDSLLIWAMHCASLIVFGGCVSKEGRTHLKSVCNQCTREVLVGREELPLSVAGDFAFVTDNVKPEQVL